MSTVSVQDLLEVYVSQIEANIDDPRDDRRAVGKKWVYDDPPAPNISDTPRIAVVAAQGAEDELRWANTTDSYAKLPVNVIIAVRKSQVITIGGTDYRDVQLIAYLEKQVRNLVKTEAFQQAVRDSGIRLLKAYQVFENNTYGNPHIRTLTFQNQVIR